MEFEKFQETFIAEKIEQLWETHTSAKVGKKIPNWHYAK
jgi:hypothetical protein